jgi:hypothetical protein
VLADVHQAIEREGVRLTEDGIQLIVLQIDEAIRIEVQHPQSPSRRIADCRALITCHRLLLEVGPSADAVLNHRTPAD